MTQEALKLALDGITKVPTLTHGLMVKLVDVEAAIKEALAQTQEPVAWRTFDGEGGYDYYSYEDNESYADDWNKRNPNHKGWVNKLYTHSQPEQEPVADDFFRMIADRNPKPFSSPQRTWIGLTVEEVEKIWQGVEASDFHDCVQPFAQAIGNILKEKNT